MVAIAKTAMPQVRSKFNETALYGLIFQMRETEFLQTGAVDQRSFRAEAI